MRTLVSRWIWATAAVGCVVLSSAGCKSTPWTTPGSSFATWGKKDAGSLAATKPSPNFPVSPSKNATPNAASTAALNGPGRATLSGQGNAANTSGGASSGYPLSSLNNGNSGMPPGAQSDRGFYSSTPPGASPAGGNPSKWDSANSGYMPSSGIQRSGYDYQPASLRGGEYGSSRGYDSAPVGGEYGSPPPRSASGASGAPQRNPYAAGPGYAPQPVRPPSFGPAGYDDHGHNHNHDHDHGDAGYAPPGGYGSPGKPSSSYEGSGSSGFAPPGSSSYSDPRGGFSSNGASGAGGGLAMPAGLSQRGNGYLPGSTRRSISGPSSVASAPDSFESPADARPVGYSADADAGSDTYSGGETPGGSFSEPGDEFPTSPPARFGGGSYDPR
jgi:hypothetical protein